MRAGRRCAFTHAVLIRPGEGAPERSGAAGRGRRRSRRSRPGHVGRRGGGGGFLGSARRRYRARLDSASLFPPGRRRCRHAERAARRDGAAGGRLPAAPPGRLGAAPQPHGADPAAGGRRAGEPREELLPLGLQPGRPAGARRGSRPLEPGGGADGSRRRPELGPGGGAGRVRRQPGGRPGRARGPPRGAGCPGRGAGRLSGQREARVAGGARWLGRVLSLLQQTRL